MAGLRIIIRSILSQRLNSAVIIVSLSVGFAFFNLIMLFIVRELKTDSFHGYGDRIYALKCDDPWMPGKKMYQCRFGSAEYLKKNYADVEDFCRISNGGTSKITINNEVYYDPPMIINASANFFSFFSYKLLTNNPSTVLEAKNNIVMSDDLARKYFGSEDPLGRVIKLTEEEFVVTGIFEKPAENTQINFDMVRLIGEVDSRCYIRLGPSSGKVSVEKLMDDNKESIPVIHAGTPGSYYLEPLLSAYFDTSRVMVIERSRNKSDLWIALVIGIMIMGIGSFNYLGLLNSRLTGKNKEFILRRINGSSRQALVMGFYTENLIIAGVSFMFSLLLMQDILPFFNELTGSNIPVNFFFYKGQILIPLATFLFLLLLTYLFILARVRPATDINSLRKGKNITLRQIRVPAFNIFQLTGTIVLIICSLVIIKQIGFISAKPIGLDRSVIEVKLPYQYSAKASVFRDELLKDASIAMASVTTASPVLEHFLVLLEYDQNGVKKQYSPAGFTGDENFINTLGIELIEGEGFSGNPPADKNICLINQSFAKLFSGQDLIGMGIPGMEKTIIAGIVRDFNYSGLESLIGPAFISFSSKGGHLMVKAAGNQTAKAGKAIERVWEKMIPGYPVNIESVGDRFNWFHRDNMNFLRLIITCSLISLFLSMIGLFSMAYQSSRFRTREIGIRKINGARINEIIQLLNRDYVRWILISFIVACPVALYAMHGWLSNYAYKTNLSWWIFPVAGILTLVIALLTISLQSRRVATRNPVEALRYE